MFCFMKKVVGLTCALFLLGATLPATYADAEMEKMDASYYYGYQEFTIDNILDATSNRTVERVAKEEFASISANSVMENWDYNQGHFYTKKFDLNLQIPSEIKKMVKGVTVNFEKGDMPIMYDMPEGSTLRDADMMKEMMTQYSVSVPDMTSFTLDMADLNGMADEYGSSLRMQIMLELTDGSVIPFSQKGYFYAPAQNAEGVKQHLSNLYYIANPSYGYPNMDKLLEKSFDTLRSKAQNADEYVAALKKVVARAETMSTELLDVQEKIATGVDEESDFTPELVMQYGKAMSRSNMMYDIKYRIESEMLNDDAQKLIEELFSEGQK